MVEHEIVSNRQGKYEAVSLSVLWDVAHAGVEHVTHRLANHLCPVKNHRARRHSSKPGERFDQLGLPVSLDPRKGKNLTGSNFE